ncbi:MAG: AAA family ATPase [Arcobacteraceae bacterium]
MELVYLWVEDYKNIHKQGFNFSPRFEFEYIQDKNELILKKENKEYVSIFPDNINVTAIVGENGSGKSSIFKLILFLIFCKNYKKENSCTIDELCYYLKPFDNKEMFLIIKTENGFKKISFSAFICHLQYIEFKDGNITKMKTGSEPIERKIIYKGNSLDELNQNELNFFTVHSNYMIDTFYDEYHDNWVNQIYHKKDNYDTPLLLQPNKHDSNTLNDVINIWQLEFLTTQKILKFYQNIEDNKSISNFFQPNYIKIINIIDNFILANTTLEGEVELTIISKIANKIPQIALYRKISISKLTNNTIPPALKKIEDEKDYEYMNLLYLAFKLVLSTRIKDSFNKELYDSIEKLILDSLNNDKLPTKIELQSFDYSKLLINESFSTEKIKISIDFHINKTYDNPFFKELLNDEKIKIQDLKNILTYLPMWLRYDFFQDEKSYSSLSSGEKSLLVLLIDVIYQVDNVLQKYQSINLLLDETELGLHPNWQKRYLSDLVKSISPFLDKNKTKRIHIFFSSHSPFILSDIPKENVIFLRNGKQDNPDIEQTFGANIHTLLSHGFFMENGLMGEFAKGKIEAIKDFYEMVKCLEAKNPKYKRILKILYLYKIKNFKHIQSIIGEPFLKTIMKNYLDELELIFLDENDLIDIELKALEERKKYLEKLKNAKN